MDSADLPTFSLGLDTPSKYLGGPSTGLTPASWSLGTGFTPSILGGYSASGWTPSLTAAAGAKAEFNPFEVSLDASSSSSSKRRTFTTDFLDRDEAATKGSTDSVFDLLATTPGTGGRKRALSSPAVEMGAGSTSFPFLSQPSQFNPDATSLSTAALDRRAKRPRMASMQSSNLTSQETFFSSFERESDDSPASSVVLTPPDSAPAFAGGSATGKDIAVAVAQADHNKQPPLPPPAQPQPQQPLSALSRLAQERSALIARGQSVLSQASPLPIKQATSSARPAVPIAQADISVKAEPTEYLIASSQPEAASKSAPTRRPPVTRGQSKRGTRSSVAVAGSSRDVASPSPATSLPTKRKAPRKKSSTTTATKKKEASVAAGDDDDDEEGPEGSDKRQQFLERNRVAACKSRQKKKEKVAGLEQFAADLCARNNILQQTAFALRQEALALRQLVHAHVGCSCEHAQGYIARDAAGGGIATIDQLAGRTLKLDYSIPPAMGTEDDVYSFIDNGGAAPAAMLDSPERGKSLVPPNAPGPAIPIVARPTVGGPSSSSSPVRRAGMTTRRSSQAVQHAQRASYGGGNGGRTAGGDAAFRAAVQNNHLGLSMNGVPMDADLASSMLANGMRATSAPPTTPGWGDAAPSGDYFAPKRRSIAVVA